MCEYKTMSSTGRLQPDVGIRAFCTLANCYPSSAKRRVRQSSDTTYGRMMKSVSQQGRLRRAVETLLERAATFLDSRFTELGEVSVSTFLAMPSMATWNPEQLSLSQAIRLSTSGFRLRSSEKMNPSKSTGVRLPGRC